MTKIPSCKLGETFWALNPGRREYFEQKQVYQLQVIMTDKCAGGCTYCSTSSDPTKEHHLTKEVLFDIIDQAVELGVKSACWAGGDALLHPAWQDVVSYGLEKGMGGSVWTSGLITKKEAKILTSFEPDPLYEATGVHIDTIDPESYAKINGPGSEKVLDKKIQGYYTLLEAGHSPEKIMPNLTVTGPMVDSFEETCDWFVDEMGAKMVVICAFKPCGYAKDTAHLEPTTSDMRRAHEYVAKKLGGPWLEIGGTPLGSIFCQTDMHIYSDGNIYPCALWPPEFSVGNVYKDRLRDVFEANRDDILLRHEIKGPCGSCEKNPFCIGCRSNALYYLGDRWESDPKCWLNPEAKELYLH